MEELQLNDYLNSMFEVLENGKSYRCKHFGDSVLFHNQDNILEYEEAKFINGVKDLKHKIDIAVTLREPLTPSDRLLLEILLDMVHGHKEMSEFYNRRSKNGL